MINLKKYSILIIMILLVFQSIPAIAGDSLARFLGNDQDILVIGQVTDINDDITTLKSSRFLTSKHPLNTQKYNTERPEYIKIKALKYDYYSKDGLGGFEIPKVSDIIVASLHKDTDGTYKNKWGVYKLDTLDYKTAKVLIPDKSLSDGYIGSLCAITLFINSDGNSVIRGFGSDNKELTLYDESKISYADPSKFLSTVAVTAGNNGDTTLPNNNNNESLLILAGAVVVLGLVFVVLNRIRKAKKSSEQIK